MTRMHSHTQPQAAPAPSEKSHVHETGSAKSARASRARRVRQATTDPDSWLESRDGRVAHERALEDLECERVQRFDHADFLAAFQISWVPARVEWTVTDEFTRRHERLRGRSHRAVGAALTSFIVELARTAPHAHVKDRPGLQLRRCAPDSLAPELWALSWSSVGRATFRLEWHLSDAGPVAHVTWLAIGPHGTPDRRRSRSG